MIAASIAALGPTNFPASDRLAGAGGGAGPWSSSVAGHANMTAAAATSAAAARWRVETAGGLAAAIRCAIALIWSANANAPAARSRINTII